MATPVVKLPQDGLYLIDLNTIGHEKYYLVVSDNKGQYTLVSGCFISRIIAVNRAVLFELTYPKPNGLMGTIEVTKLFDSPYDAIGEYKENKRGSIEFFEKKLLTEAEKINKKD